jgi:uncharacterized protein with NRDE domain
MHWWPEINDRKSLLAGKDLLAGGTWLGINKQGRFSALTNFRQPQLFDKTKQSRGDLVLQALNNQDSVMSALLNNSSHHFNGFNLVFGQLDNLSCYDSTSQTLQPLSTGFHSLCNGALDDIWPKMALGQAQLANTVKDLPLNIDRLFTLMANNEQAQAQHLPKTGISLDWEQLLSSIFIVSPEYGTRTTNIILQDNQGNITVYDRSYNNNGQCIEEQNFSI